jgi:hypothetical protein
MDLSAYYPAASNAEAPLNQPATTLLYGAPPSDDLGRAVVTEVPPTFLNNIAMLPVLR